MGQEPRGANRRCRGARIAGGRVQGIFPGAPESYCRPQAWYLRAEAWGKSLGLSGRGCAASLLEVALPLSFLARSCPGLSGVALEE